MIDPARVYLAGRGPAAAAVFYTISRVPDLWAAGIAIDGSPQPAIDTGRIYAANFSRVPVLWVSADPGAETLADQLKKAGLNLEYRAAAGVTNAAILEWLNGHKRDAFPTEIDCETNSPTFASCYWIQMTKFDPAERNDVLPRNAWCAADPAHRSTWAASATRLDDPGPGVLVSFLPEKYNGPLKMGDRIVTLDGRPLEQRAAVSRKPWRSRPRSGPPWSWCSAAMSGIAWRRASSCRGAIRASPRAWRASICRPSARLQVVSRTVKEMKSDGAGAVGAAASCIGTAWCWRKSKQPGCWLLTIEKELLRAAKCQ